LSKIYSIINSQLTQYHLDPSIIIQTPIPIEVILKLIAYSLVWDVILLLLANILFMPQSKSFPHSPSPLSIVTGSIFIYHVFIISGFHPSYFPKQTLLSSIYVAVHTICTPIVSDTTEDPIKENQGEIHATTKMIQVWSHLFGPSQSKLQSLHQATFYGSLVGMGLMALLRILDHGMQIQRHPVPILLGCAWGRVVGLIIGVLSEWINSKL
jgi:hypothetical protein